jgi:hypothetical protein
MAIKLTDKVSDFQARVLMQVAERVKERTGRDMVSDSHQGAIRLWRDQLGQDYILNGGAVCVVKRDGSVDVPLEEDDSYRSFREKHPILTAAAGIALGIAALGSAGCGDGGDGGGSTGPITNLQVTTAPTQVNPGQAVILGGTAVNADNYSHGDESTGTSVGNNGDAYYPHTGINNLVFVASNLDTYATLHYQIIGKYRDETAEEHNSPSDFAAQPDMMTAEQWDFIKTQLSSQAQTELAAVEALLNPSYEDPLAWGVNEDGLYVQSEILDANEIQGYSDSNSDGNPDYTARITSISFPALSDSTLAELQNYLDSVLDEAGMQQLIGDYLTHVYSSAVQVYNDLAAYFLPLTGKSIEADVNASVSDLGSGPGELNFAIYPTTDDRSDVESERSQNGQDAGSTYTGVSAAVIELADTVREIVDKVWQEIKYHQDNQ